MGGANGSTVGMQYIYPPIHAAIFPYAKGPQNHWPFWLKTPYCRVQVEKSNAEARLRLTIDKRETDHSTTRIRTHHRERPIHRLSAVGLPRSLRAGNCGPCNQWLKRTVAITHSHLLDMPPHQLPARSQILHRVSILVEAKPQN